jgi:hypothetical protein
MVELLTNWPAAIRGVKPERAVTQRQVLCCHRVCVQHAAVVLSNFVDKHVVCVMSVRRGTVSDIWVLPLQHSHTKWMGGRQPIKWLLPNQLRRAVSDSTTLGLWAAIVIPRLSAARTRCLSA